MGTPENSGIGLVLLTGGSGFVGSRVARRLASDGVRIRAVVRSRDGAPELADPAVAPFVELVEGEFSRPEVADAAARGVDAVVHGAATSGPDLEPVRQVNVEGTRAMVEAALRACVRRYVQISTISVYARGPEGLLDEDAPIKSDGDPYGWTKADGDRAVFAGIERGLPGVILRPGAILGVHRTSTWAVKMPARIRDGQVKLRGDGRELLPWVHVEDLCEAVLLALREEAAAGRAYNAADGDMSWRRYTDDVRSWFDTPPLEEIPPEEFGGYWMGRYDGSRIRRELGYRPKHTYEEGMGEAASYWAKERSRT